MEGALRVRDSIECGVLEQLGHHACARLRDGATLTFISNVHVIVFVEANPYGDFIAASRVDLKTLPRRVVKQARATRVLVVVEDNLLIQGFDVVAHATPKNS